MKCDICFMELKNVVLMGGRKSLCPECARKQMIKDIKERRERE